MATIDDLAAIFSESRRLEVNRGMSTPTIATGTATEDSDGGSVKVIISDDTEQPTGLEGLEVEIPTTTKVNEGDEVIITQIGTGTTKTPIVTGVIGRGDEIADMASEAQEAADAVGQHFFADENGVHVATKEGRPNYGPNLLANTQGILLRQGTILRSAHTPSGFSVYDGINNNPENVIAAFGKSASVIGSTAGIHTKMSEDGIQTIDPSLEENKQQTFFVGDRRGYHGIANWETADQGQIFVFGSRSDFYNAGTHSATFGNNAAAQGDYSFATGDGTNAAGGYSVAEGMGTVANAYSHAEGQLTRAEGSYSHTEGQQTKTGSAFAHAGGSTSEALHYASFVHGYGLKTNANYQAVFGKFNTLVNDALFVVGNGELNGESEIRSNAFEVKNDGSVKTARQYLTPVSLFNSTDGSTSNTITLSDTVANYEFIEVLFSNSDGLFSSVKLRSPGSGSKNVLLSTGSVTDSNQWKGKAKAFTVSGNTLVSIATNSGMFHQNGTNATVGRYDTVIKVHEVLGY